MLQLIHMFYTKYRYAKNPSGVIGFSYVTAFRPAFGVRSTQTLVEIYNTYGLSAVLTPTLSIFIFQREDDMLLSSLSASNHNRQSETRDQKQEMGQLRFRLRKRSEKRIENHKMQQKIRNSVIPNIFRLGK